MATKLKKFKNSQRFRIIHGTACFYTTAGVIRSFGGVGDFAKFNRAVLEAFETLEKSLNVGHPATGITGSFNSLAIQIDIAQ